MLVLGTGSRRDDEGGVLRFWGSILRVGVLLLLCGVVLMR